MPDLIKTVFSILGTLMISIILFIMIFTATGQSFLWGAIEPAMLSQWRQSTMDNGAQRTITYENIFDTMKSNEYSRQVNTN